jgi:hypothetical protein
MKKTNLIYWISTGLICVVMTFSSIPNILVDSNSLEMFTHLGYPVYFIPFIGMAKLLGVIALLIPGFPKIREWAYAGLTFDLIGATYSAIASDGFAPPMLFMLVFFLLIGLSYTYHHKRLAAEND